MRSVSGFSLLLAVSFVGCGGSSVRNDSLDDAIGGETGTSTNGGSGTATAASGGSSSPSGGSAGTPICEPQDAQFVGGCLPGLEYIYTGVECVGRAGCECIGGDCDDLVPLPPVDPTNPVPNPCVVEYGGCFGITRSCDEIAAVYAEYASRNACEDDYDCVVNPGGCAVGLGGCYHVMNRGWSLSGLEALIDAWQAAGCMAAVCRCAAPPASAVCVDGVCTGAL